MTNETTSSSGGWFKGLVIGLLVLGTVACIATGAGWYYLQSALRAPMTDFSNQSSSVFVVPQGATATTIARRLEEAGLITDERLFRLAMRLDRSGATLKAGEFEIPAGASVVEIKAIIEEGKSVLYPVTIVEGATSASIIRVLEASDVLTGPVPEEPPQGSVLPDTYMVSRGMSRGQLLEQMMQAQRDLIDDLWPKRDPTIPIETPQDAIILASIVEKETGAAEERPIVASVFTNRLRQGIRLQSDPTIIYPITKGEPLGRAIRRSEIDAVNAYNTYQIDGLPVGPICNPGREAIAAVLSPPETDYLFFVADGTGGHKFSRTLREHNAAHAEWRRLRAEKIARERAE